MASSFEGVPVGRFNPSGRYYIEVAQDQMLGRTPQLTFISYFLQHKFLYYMVKRIKHSFTRINILPGPSCDNMLQPKLRSGEGCNTLSHGGFANVNMKKNVIHHCYNTFLSSTPGLNGNEALSCHVTPCINRNEAHGQ